MVPSADIPSVTRPTTVRYLAAVLAVAVAVPAQAALGAAVADRSPFLCYVVAVLLAAWFGGPGPAALAAALGGLAGSVVIWAPWVGLDVPAPTGRPPGLGYVVISGGIVLLTRAVWRLRDKASRRTAEALAQLEERRRAEDALRDREERLRTLGDNLPAGAIYQAVKTSGVPTRFTYMSAGIELLAGVTPADVVADAGSLFGLIHPDDLAGVVAAEEEAVVGLGVFECEFRLRPRSGGTRWVHARSAPRRQSDGSVVYDGLVMDVTARREAEDALREEGRRKDEFLAVLAHELRNPLAPLRTALHVLQTTTAGDAGGLVPMMSRQIALMARLLDDLLDVSRVGRGKLELRKTKVRLADVVRDAVDTSRPLVEAGRHALAIDLPTNPVWLDADPARLAQVIANLINNAAKFTEPGGRIRLAAVRTGDQVEIRVSDSGVGIPPDALPRVFEAFVQFGQSCDGQGGLGLGLALVKTLVEMHGGTVEAQSEGAGRGSEFVVRLPAAEPPAVMEPTGPATPAAGNPRRVLVVDDNADAANSLTTFLRHMGHEADAVYDGAAALDAVARRTPDVVFLDLGMPGLDGIAVARRLRADHRYGGLLVALTGWGQDEDRRRTKEAGFDRHVVKPADPDELRSLLVGADRRG